MNITKNLSVFCLIVGVFQLLTVNVYSQRTSIRGSYERQRQRESNRVGGYNHGRPDREGDQSGSDPFAPSNNSGGNSNGSGANLVLVPQCNPSDPKSYYNSYENARDSSDCDQYLSYCDRKYSGMDFSSGWMLPRDFYESMREVYDRCFRSCSERSGGPQRFCSMPEPSRGYTSSLSQESRSYCSPYAEGSPAWTRAMEVHEAEVLLAMNIKRSETGGTVCNRRNGNDMISTFYPRSSPVVVNPQLSCAARIQAQNIVMETLETGRFPSNLHNACPSSTFLSSSAPICEGFTTRMMRAGYPYQSQGFGSVNEVTAVNYRTAEAVVGGWLSSTSGHCSAIVKQESPFVPTEVGIGYFESGGITGHVVIVGQLRS
ncbi:unnamed protein product [Pseudo-nitzschia multistriata]|uniref:Uncharacterized protein n=1 Tax=Pseudo-nitzschia multistriata TaxID=183589 RepID=A0A448YWY6_9STRA|nr:unnamed protein product [Pseudo-nitzschia multistriata]